MIREHEQMMNLFKTLVIPILDYGSVIWNPHKLKDIALLEKVQRNYTKRLQTTTSGWSFSIYTQWSGVESVMRFSTFSRYWNQWFPMLVLNRNGHNEEVVFWYLPRTKIQSSIPVQLSTSRFEESTTVHIYGIHKTESGHAATTCYWWATPGRLQQIERCRIAQLNSSDG